MLAPTLSPTGRLQEELDRVLGPRRHPRLEDQRSLPYTNAVLHEVQRFITLLPHVPRCMAADTQLGGYLLPKVGTPLLDPDRVGRALPPPSLPLLSPFPPSFFLLWVRVGPAGLLGGPSLSVHTLGEGGARPSPPAAPPTGHTCDPPAELCAPGQDTVGDAPPVQPGPLPGR